ncbi:MAG: tRNA (adenosine(37)-N6)-dimethylallyltransferase MiaA [Oscillospiraceae bacterium]|nr:tRNA (adenosine(37)-N6)-dimethylallyltransferase MiaA [Oscillospiraceae bacterium]
MEKTFIIVVCGPTASGKTALAVRLAEEFNGEIIGADSMQVYKGMDIATAKPTSAELRGIRHHLIDFLEPHEPFSVADYVELARAKITEVRERGKLPVIAGGTGLYINSLIDNIEFPEIKADMAFRAEMRGKNAGFLLGELLKKDPETAALLHENNLKRIIRALEVFHVTGRTMSDLKRESRLVPSPYKPLMLQINFPREKLYERINKRADEMLEAGLAEEARAFYTLQNPQTAAQAIGYKELLPFLNGEAELSHCVERLKQSTRNYAKRQLTWFKKDPRINLLAADEFLIDKSISLCYNYINIVSTP